LIWPEKDRVSFDIPLQCEGNPPSICFALLKKRVIKSSLDQFEDLKLLTKRFKVEGVSEKLGIFSDHKEILPALLDKDAKEFFKKYEEYIESIHITDRQTFLIT
jgi:Protein of unknown function (DUF1682)